MPSEGMMQSGESGHPRSCMIDGMSGTESMMGRGRQWPVTAGRRRWPTTLWIGIIWIAACEALLFGDVIASHRRALRSQGAIMEVMSREPATALGRVARWTAVNMTPLV